MKVYLLIVGVHLYL